MSDLDIGVLNSDRNYSGLVDSTDPFDLYKFSLNSPGKVGVSLTGLTGNADLEVLDTGGRVLYNSANGDWSDEAIAIDNLAAGNYTIRVNQVSGEANYNLNLTVENIQVDPLTGLNIESGYFIVGETGQVGVDFINDGGGYKGELSIFSLDGMDKFVPGSVEFIKEAAKRSLTNSNLGYVVISDTNEAAKFNVGLANADNDGEYKGIKTFAMKSGDTFGVMLVPNGKVQEVWDNPNIGGSKRPLFSLVTANPNEAFHIGQVADINGTGSAFAIEDQRVDTGTDKDYNDVVFKLTGATGKAVNLDEVINPEKDWRNSKLGKDLIDYVKKEELAIDPKPPVDTTPIDPKPPVDTTPIDPKPPVDTTPVDPKPPVDTTPVDPKPPVDTTPVDPKPPVDTTPVDPKPPVDTTPVDPKPPVDTTPVDPKPPVDTTPVDPKPPVDTTPIDPKPPVDTTPVDPTPPIDSTPVDPTPPIDPIPVDPTPVDPTPIYYAGNTLATARDLGTLRVNASEIGYSLGIRDFVNNVDRYDYYRFNFEDTNNFNLRLDDLSGDAKVELIQDLNNNNQVDEGEVLEISDGGTASQLINRTPLDKGIYYVRVSSREAGDTNYSISLMASSPEVSIAPNQPLIGIIDTGFSRNNADLDYRRFKLGSDRISNDNNPLLSPGEGNEHGTHILGLIAATQGNGIGIDGINDKAPIWLGRAVGSGNWAESLIEFVDAAKQSGQKNAVVNLSLDLTQVNPDGSVTTRYELTPKEREAIEFARQNHVLIVTAAGNDGGVMSVLGQASQEFDNIITVGASNEFDRANYSSYGAGLDILTEGGTIDKPVISTVGNSLGKMAGTSVAAAKVTGVASLVWAANPDLNFKQVISILESTATDLKTSGWDGETGFGLLNSAAAVELAKKTVGENYTPEAWVAPFIWDGEGKVTPTERAAQGGISIATAPQFSPAFSDNDKVDSTTPEKYYQFTVNQPGYVRWTLTRTNGSNEFPGASLVKVDSTPGSFKFVPGGPMLSGTVVGQTPPISITNGVFVDPGTYYLKLRGGTNNTVQNYNLSNQFIPDSVSAFQTPVNYSTTPYFDFYPDIQTKAFNGSSATGLNVSGQVEYKFADLSKRTAKYGLEVKETGKLNFNVLSPNGMVEVRVEKFIGSEDKTDNLAYYEFAANANYSREITLNKGRYQIEIKANGDQISDINQILQLPYTLKGVFSRLAPKPGEANVPVAAGNFIKTVTSNGVDTHYYTNGYLSVQPKGTSTWYTSGTGTAIPILNSTITPIEAPPDYAGNTLSTARDLGKLSVNASELSFSLGVNEFVGDLDKYDYYRFNFDQTNNFNLLLNGLSADAKVELIQDLNNNGQVDLGEILESSTGGSAAQLINRTPLEKGIYYVRVSSNKAWADTNYNLGLTATAIPDKAGNTLDKAFNLGNLSFRQTFQQDFLHTNDRNDFYRFDLTTTRQVDFAFDNSRAMMNLYIIQDKNKNNQIEYEEVSEVGSINRMADSFSITLEPGTYYALAQLPKDIDTYTDYNLKIATNPPDYAGNDFFKAREILIDSKPKFFTDFVGQPDNQDFYHFKLNEKRKFESLLYGLNGSASIELIQDSNNNGLFDASDLKLVSSSGSSDQKINASLEPGDYYIRISPQQTNNNTYYNLDFSALIGAVPVLDFYTQPVPQYETDIDKEYQNFSGLLGNPTGGYAPATPSGNGTTGYWKGFDTGTIHWTPQYGAVALWHDFQNVYNQTGGSGGWLGFPTKDKYDWEGGQRIDFESGYIFWTSNEGAKAYRPWESPWQLTSPDNGNSGSSSPIDGMIPYEFGQRGTLDDTLWEIAQLKLGDGSRWQEILKPDGSSYTEDEARRISVGTIVYLPTNVNNGSSNNGGGSSGGNSGGNNSGGSNSPIQGKIPYVLGQRGTSDDSLWEIAQLTLGDGSRWRYEIFKPDGSNYTDEEATRIPRGTIVYLPENANVGGTPGSGTPGSGTPGSGTPGSGTPGSGTPGGNPGGLLGGSITPSDPDGGTPGSGYIAPAVVSINSVSSIGIRGQSMVVSGNSNTQDMQFYIGNTQVGGSLDYLTDGTFTARLNIPSNMFLGNYQVKVVAKNQLGLTNTFNSNSWINVTHSQSWFSDVMGITNGGEKRFGTLRRIDGQNIANQPTWIVIHGMNSNPWGNIEKLAQAIDNYEPNDNLQVLTLDWSKAAEDPLKLPNPHVGGNWITAAASFVVNTLKNSLGISSLWTNIAGHSLGSYVGYEVSKQFGGINKLVALDPATTTLGGYTNRTNVNFSEYSQWSWGFYSSLLGSEDQAKTAHESFKLVFPWTLSSEGHGAGVKLWTNMLKNRNGSVSRYFGLEDMNSSGKPWHIDNWGFGSGWEAKIEAVDTDPRGGEDYADWFPVQGGLQAI